jgi:hypothetical protein
MGSALWVTSPTSETINIIRAANECDNVAQWTSLQLVLQRLPDMRMMIDDDPLRAMHAKRAP